MSGTLTLDGSFHLGEHEWYWDVNGVYGVNDAHQMFTGNVNAANACPALGPVANCTGALRAAQHLRRRAGSITPAMLNYVDVHERDKSYQRLWRLHRQPVAATCSTCRPARSASRSATSIATRTRSYRSRSDHRRRARRRHVPTSPARGGFNVDEVYGELRVPFLTDTPFFE